jgi:hypothetical protein
MSPSDPDFDRRLYALIMQDIEGIALQILERVAHLRDQFPQDLAPELEEVLLRVDRKHIAPGAANSPFGEPHSTAPREVPPGQPDECSERGGGADAGTQPHRS